MPFYEYRCLKCGRVTQVFVRSYSTVTAPVCRRCGATELRKLVSRFATVKSEDSRLDDLADPSQFGDVDENDPRSVARWMRRMGSELGEDLGDDFDEMVDRMEAGEMPDETSLSPEGMAGGDSEGII